MRERSPLEPLHEIGGVGSTFGYPPALSPGLSVLQNVIEAPLRSPIGGHFAQFVHDEARTPDPCTLRVLEIDARISDVGLGHADDLSIVRGIGQNFLIPRHRSIEDHFPVPAVFLPFSEGIAPKKSPGNQSHLRVPKYLFVSFIEIFPLFFSLIDDFSADDRGDYSSFEFPAQERRISTFRKNLIFRKRPF